MKNTVHNGIFTSDECYDGTDSVALQENREALASPLGQDTRPTAELTAKERLARRIAASNKQAERLKASIVEQELQRLEQEDEAEDEQPEQSGLLALPKTPPPDLFHQQVERLLAEAACAFRVPRSLAVHSLLSVATAAAGATAAISPEPGHLEHSILWLGLIGHPGVGKTPIQNFFFETLQASAGEALWQQYLKELQEWESLSRKDPDDLDEDEKLIVEAGEPVPQRLTCDDHTGEVLADLLEANRGRGILLRRDEGAGLLSSLDKYRPRVAKGGNSDKSRLLDLWRPFTWELDRRSGKKKHRRIRHACASISCNFQPRKMPLCFDSGDLDDGFLQRFIWFRADTPSILLKSGAERQPISQDSKDLLSGIVIQLASLQLTAELQPALIAEMGGKTKRYFEEWCDKVTLRLSPLQSSGLLQTLAPKIHDNCARVSLMMHLIELARAAYTQGKELASMFPAQHGSHVIDMPLDTLEQACRLFDECLLPSQIDALELASITRQPTTVFSLLEQAVAQIIVEAATSQQQQETVCLLASELLERVQKKVGTSQVTPRRLGIAARELGLESCHQRVAKSTARAWRADAQLVARLENALEKRFEL